MRLRVMKMLRGMSTSRRLGTLDFSRLAWAVAVVFVLATGGPAAAQESTAGAATAPFPEASALIAAGKFGEAESGLRAAIAAAPGSADARFLLAYALLRENKPTESLSEYTQAARLRTPSAEELKNVALDYVLLKSYSDADRWISRSVEMDSKDADAWYVLGRIRYERKRYQDAVDGLERALALSPKNVKAENNLGLAYEGLSRPDDAVAAYRQAIAWQRGSDHPSEQPLVNLAVILMHQNALDEALPLLVEAAAIAPRDAKIHEQLGQIYMKQGHADKAQTEFQTALALTPESAALHFLLGQAYRREGMQEQAKAELARAAALIGTHSTPNPE